jgi:hypothetical protein
VYFTHHFSNIDSLSRARSWLSLLGFSPEQIEAHSDGVPRIALAIEPSEWAGVEMLINAVERSDPHGWPSFHDVARLPHIYPEGFAPVHAGDLQTPGSSAIGWNPLDRAPHQDS